MKLSSLDESYWRVLLSESGHDAAFMHEIWDIFQRDARMTLQNLQGIEVATDTAALIEHSHRLAGLAANLACQSLHAVCARIERLAGELQQAPSGNDDVVTTIEQQVAHLPDLLQRTTVAWEQRLSCLDRGIA